MIRYDLVCKDGHGFDSWFSSSQTYDSLRQRGHLSCPVCGTSEVLKALMAPAVRTATPPDSAATIRAPEASVPAMASSLAPEMASLLREAALAKLRRELEANSEYVGLSFATEARRMHEGDVPERAIHGEARPEDARRLIEDGIPVAPLPFIPSRQQN
jgi:hypothetical protein